MAVIPTLPTNNAAPTIMLVVPPSNIHNAPLPLTGVPTTFTHTSIHLHKPTSNDFHPFLSTHTGYSTPFSQSATRYNRYSRPFSASASQYNRPVKTLHTANPWSGSGSNVYRDLEDSSRVLATVKSGYDMVSLWVFLVAVVLGVLFVGLSVVSSGLVGRRGRHEGVLPCWEGEEKGEE